MTDTSHWKNAVSGKFSNAADWTDGVPGVGVIDAIGARYSVLVDTSAAIQSLTLNSAQATLHNSAVLNVTGALDIERGKLSPENDGSAQSLTLGTGIARFFEDQGLQFSIAGAFDIRNGTASLDGTCSAQTLTMDTAGATLNMFAGDLTVRGAFEIDKGSVSLDESDCRTQSLTLDTRYAAFTETSDSSVHIAGALTIDKGSVTLAGTNNSVGSVTVHGGGSLHADGAIGDGPIAITAGGKIFGSFTHNDVAVSGSVFIGPSAGAVIGGHFTFAPDTDNQLHFGGEGGSATLDGGVASSDTGPNLITIQKIQLIADSTDAVTMLNKAEAIEVYHGAVLGISASFDQETFSGNVSGRGSLSFSGNDIITLSGHNQTTGNVTITNATLDEETSNFFRSDAIVSADSATFIQHAGINKLADLETKGALKFEIATTTGEQDAGDAIYAGLTLLNSTFFSFFQKPLGAGDIDATITFNISSLAGLVYGYDIEIGDLTLRSGLAYRDNFHTFIAVAGDVILDAGGILDVTGQNTTIVSLSGSGEILNTGAAENLTIDSPDAPSIFSGTIKGDFTFDVSGDFTGTTFDLQPDNLFVVGAGGLNLSDTHFTSAQADIVLGNGNLIVDHAFGGAIRGISSNTKIDISDETFDGAPVSIKYTENGTGTGGELTVKDGSQAAIHLQLIGHYATSDFSVMDDFGELSIRAAVSQAHIAHITDAFI